MANNEIQNNKQQTSYCNLHRNFKTMKAFKDDPLKSVAQRFEKEGHSHATDSAEIFLAYVDFF